MTATAIPFELAGADHRPIRGDALVNDAATGAVVLVHGFKGFGRFGFFPYLGARLADAGLNVVSFDFSGSGVGEDRETFTDFEAFAANTFTKELDDLDIVWGQAADRGWLAGPTGLFGFSRGGGIAILCAARKPDVKALVTWSSISTVRRWSDETIALWRERGYTEVENSRTKQIFRIGTAILDEVETREAEELNILRAASNIRVPWLIVHGLADETVPVHEGRQLHSASEHRAELVLVERASHTYNSRHGMTEPTPELEAAVDRTTRFFHANLAP